MFKIIKNHQRGIGLLEMIVVVAIFSVTILAATDIFKWVVEGQRNALAAQNVQENMRYAFETMAKEIRMAQRSDTGCYSSGIYKVYNKSSSAGDDRLYFRNKSSQCVSYYLNNNQLMVDRAGTATTTISNVIKISNLKFNVVDDLIAATHTMQPRITMAMDIEAVGKIMHRQKIRLEFTISSRYYE